MKKYIESQASQHEMKLIQMGAKCEQINSKMCYVEFTIDDIEIAYVYSINKKNRYFLERIKPYPLPIKDYENEEDVIKIIEIDIRQFQNASKSKHISEFIEINSKLSQTLKEFEDLYLYYNIPSEDTKNILDKINDIHKDILEIKYKSKRVFFEKDPDFL